MREGKSCSETPAGVLAGVRAVLLLAAGAVLLAPGALEAQRLSYSEGQPVYPAYEGWERNEDGSYSFLFGYMNENWEDHAEIPVGEDNFFSPGPADRGQPTFFMPRRNRFVFKVRVPADFGRDEELTWTVRSGDEEYTAYATLREDYFIDNVVIMSETGALGAGTSSPEIRANVPPTIELEGPSEREVRVGEPLELVARVTDDGQPNRETITGRPAEPEPERTPGERLEWALGESTASSTVSKRTGLHLTWFPYRGPEGADLESEVEFDPPQIKPWEDTRPFANSPWAPAWVPPHRRSPSELPEDGRWKTTITFDRPGTYRLRGRADDGGLYSDTEILVRVRPFGAG